MLIVQDDTRPCGNFAAALERIAVINPHTPVALFIGGAVYRTSKDIPHAVHRGQPYVTVRLSDPLPVVATLWPVQKAAEFLAWTNTNPRATGGPGRDRSDDAWAGAWMRRTHQHVVATAPSLVEHHGQTPSLIRPRQVTDNRRAAMFIGDGDPLEIDWMRT